MSPTKSFRRAVENFKAIFKAIPTVVEELKYHTEREILRSKVHKMVDKGIEMYGDSFVAIAKNVDVEMIASAAFDFIALVEKWKEPMKLQANTLIESLKPINEKFNTEYETLTKEAATILKNIAESQKWEERFTPDNEKLIIVKEEKDMWENFMCESKVYEFANKIREEDALKTFDTKRSVKTRELTEAVKNEAKTFFTRKEGESINAYWLRCRKGIETFETKFEDFIEMPTTSTKEKTTKSK